MLLYSYLIYEWLHQSVFMHDVLKYVPVEKATVAVIFDSRGKQLFIKNAEVRLSCHSGYMSARLTGQVWRFHQCGWLCLEVCLPRSLSSRACLARTACSAAGCTCARGTAASASPCWCRRRCESLGTASRAPGGKAARSYLWSPGN